MTQREKDEKYMRLAIEQARIAFEEDEIPIGAVIVINDKVVAKAHNQTETLNDVTAHAEIIALTSAENYLGAKYLQDATIYVTVEPCVMCTGAIFWSKIKRLVIGTSDEKFGYYKFEKILNKENLSLQHPKLELTRGILQDECSSLMKEFFREKRKK